MDWLSKWKFRNKYCNVNGKREKGRKTEMWFEQIKKKKIKNNSKYKWDRIGGKAWANNHIIGEKGLQFLLIHRRDKRITSRLKTEDNPNSIFQEWLIVVKLKHSILRSCVWNLKSIERHWRYVWWANILLLPLLVIAVIRVLCSTPS